MNRVNFIICGAQKAGTTALYALLSEHPEIGTGDKKEIHFFDREPYLNIPFVSQNRYHHHFRDVLEKPIVMEATPIYMYWKPVAERIYKYNPSCKLLFILRDPAERAYSQYKMEYGRGKESLSFDEAIEAEINGIVNKQDRVRSYVDRGRYAEQLKRYFHYFTKEQMMILDYEKFKLHPKHTVYEILGFLGLDSDSYIYLDRQLNVSDKPDKCPAAERKLIKSLLKDDIEELQDMISWDCSYWLKDE